MRKTIVTLVLLLCGACGDERSEPERDGSSKPPQGEPCVPEALDTRYLCIAHLASCGEIEVVDSCDDLQIITCGSCSEWETCRDGACVEAPEAVEGCLLVPEGGTCVDLTHLERCVESEGGFEVVAESCAPGAFCEETETGAACRPIPETCEGSLSLCATEEALLACEEGALVETICPHGCTHTAEGARCREPLPGTVLHEGRIVYEHHRPRDDMRGWAPLERRPAAGLVVFSFSGEELLDSARVGEEGGFQVLVHEEPRAEDHLLVLAQARFLGGETAAVAVMDPGLPPGTHAMPSTATPWSWRFDAFASEELVITEELGGGAVQIFQAIHATVSHVASLRGPFVPNPSAFWAPGVDFSCGACFSRTLGLLLSGGAFKSHRLDSVLFHESGHYAAIEGFGLPSAESGIHCLGVPAPPGQALLEGHASWYAADRLKESRLFREAEETFYYVDFDGMAPAQYFVPPRSDQGIHQDKNETWVSATMWWLAKVNRGSRILHEAMLAPELQVPLAGGYTGKYWTSVDGMCRPVNPMANGSPTAIFTDFVDALLCGGYPREPVRRYVSRYLPYDPDAPACK